MRGVGRDLHASLTVHHPRFALQSIDVETDGTSESKPMTAALAPSQIVTGRVTYADTGEPVPHAPLGVMAGRGRVRHCRRFRDRRRRAVPRQFLAVGPHLHRLGLFRPTGSLTSSASGEPRRGPRGRVEQSLDLALPRGVLIHGKVTEEGSGKPVPGATVELRRSWGPGGSGNREHRSRTAPMARSSSAPSPSRVTSSSGAPATITCSRTIGYRDDSAKASRAAGGSTRTPSSHST